MGAALLLPQLDPPQRAMAQELRPWMQPEIGQAWGRGFRGQGTTITVIDDFRSRSRLSGVLATTTQQLRHGEWTAMQAGMIAPAATIQTQDFAVTTALRLRPGLNTLNLSYGMIAANGFGAVNWSPREASILAHARNGTAVVVKAAGNDAVAVGTPDRQGNLDYLARDLIGGASTLFVGALNAHGTPASRASLANYSNRAGSNVTVQRQFLVVGVTGNRTNLYGTSFAAPIVAGYAAVLGSKFTRATPTQIANQLLNTARTDTIQNYSAAVHGRGEASIARALAPATIR